MNDLMTKEQFQAVLPPQVKKNISQDLIDDVNNMLADPETVAVYRENVIGFADVMSKGRFKITNYLAAVKYVSFVMLGSNNFDAYIKTFPDKYAGFISRGVPKEHIYSYAKAFKGSKLVIEIMRTTMVPVCIVNQANVQEAINTQVDLMRNAKSEKVRNDACTSLIVNLKQPETVKMELDIGVSDNNGAIQELRDATSALAEQHQRLIKSGHMSAHDVAQSELMIAEEEDIIDV
jgi:hypothetical protein